MRMTRITMATGLAFMLAQGACGQEPESDLVVSKKDKISSQQGEAGADGPYRHPLAHSDVQPLAGQNTWSPGVAVAEGQAIDETGNRVIMSGIRTVERRPMSAAERAELAREKASRYGAQPARRAEPAIGPLLGQLIDMHESGALVKDGSEEQAVEVVMALRRPAELPIFEQMEQAIARGQVVTRADRDRVHADIARARQADIARLQAPVMAAVERAGGTVLYRADNMHFVIALVPISSVRALAARGDVARVDLNTVEDDEADGEDIIKAQQIEQFITAGYDGENAGNTYDLTFAQVEGGGADNEHPGFGEGTGTATRIRGMYSCSGACSSTGDFATADETGHASTVAGIIFGDLRDGQDSSVTTTSDRLARSGYAGETRGWLYKGLASDAFNHIAGTSGGTAPVVVNMSAGKADADPACQGRDTRSRAANEMFEAGKLLIKSAGNEYHPSTTDCTVTSPGSAIGAISVASIGSSSYSSESVVRTATITGFSSRGGTGSEGGGRTIVDLAAYGYRLNLFDESGGYSRSGGGTSYAAPTVTATALNFIDHYKHEYSDLIDNPGVLAANLLLMGDRQKDDGSRATYGYDNLYGAGRLRARRFDSGGMDAPWAYSNGWVCISDKETHTLTINSGAAISSDVETFKAVLWWYDSRHEVNGTLDDIDLRLKTTAGTTLRSSVSLDNKERVFYQGIGGNAIKLEIYGYNVTADDTGCGSNAMKVYYAYFYEDSDRDDVDGPGAEIEAD